MESLLKKYLYPSYSFDQIFLGMGNDGHIASLFPNSEELFSKNNIERTKKHNNYERITITLELIKKAKHVFLILLGEKKISTFNNIVNNKIVNSPIYHAINASKKMTIISTNES